MRKHTPAISEAFILALQLELENHPEGIGEYDLMQRLRAQNYFEFLASPAMPEELFRAHFVLFHALYLLRDIFLEQELYLLEIHTLKIQLLPYKKGENGLQTDDKLREYYLDFKNLENTSEDDVYEMLASFWKMYQKIDSREDALAELDLKDPVDDKIIKEKYRRLVMQHHPDRGGDTEKLKKINDALASLLGCNT